MGAVIAAVVGFVATAGAAAAGFVAANLLVSATIAALTINALLFRAQVPNFNTDVDLRREQVVRSAIEPRNIIYGQTLVGGVLSYMNVAGTDNKDMWVVVSHAGHEVEDITDMYIYDALIGSANISWGAGVTGGKYFIGSVPYVSLYRNLGTPTQAVISALDTAFTDVGTNHRGRGVAYTATKLTLELESEKVFEAGAPQKIKALIKGKNDIYDPRLDSSPGNDPTNATYQAYTTNPILIAANYMTDARVGMGISVARIDWQVVADEADYCDVLVLTSTAGTTEKRFTANGMLVTTNSHRDNIADILSACNGRMSYRSGKFNLRAGRFGVGANLISNGTFDSNVTGWSVGVNGGVQGFTTVVGRIYTARATIKSSSSESNTYQLAKSDNSNGSSPDVSNNATAVDKSIDITFTATATTSYICLNSTANAASTVTYDSTNGGQLLVTDTLGGTAAFDDLEVYLVSQTAINEDWLAGDIALQTATPKDQRFNTCRGFYVSTDDNYQKVQALEVNNTAFITRDDGKPLYESFNLPFTTHEDGAQRILHKRLQQTDEQQVLQMPCNYKALKVAVHDFVHVTIDEFSWTNKIFRVIGWRLTGNDGGVNLILQEDSAAGYQDPDTNDYSTRTSSGGVTVAVPEVPDPTSVVLTAKEGGNLVEWVNPGISDYFDVIEVYAHTSNSFGSASLLAEIRGTSFFHKLDNGENRYYWVRAKKGNENGTEVATTPTNSTAANALATAAQTANWSQVVDDQSFVPTSNPLRTIEDLQDAFAAGDYALVLRMVRAIAGGYEGAARIIGDLYGGTDGGTLLMDLLNGTLEGIDMVDTPNLKDNSVSVRVEANEAAANSLSTVSWTNLVGDSIDVTDIDTVVLMGTATYHFTTTGSPVHYSHQHRIRNTTDSVNVRGDAANDMKSTFPSGVNGVAYVTIPFVSFEDVSAKTGVKAYAFQVLMDTVSGTNDESEIIAFGLKK